MIQNTKLENRKGESMNHSLPNSEILYSALVNKDSNFEGIFVVGVKTTGIFCRLTCTARKPSEQTSSFLLRRMTRSWPAIGHARFAPPWNIKVLPLTGLNHCWLKSMMIH